MTTAPHHDTAYLASTLTQLSQQLADAGDAAEDDLTTAALRLTCRTVPGARWASLTHRPARPRTMAASDRRAALLDEFQYRAGAGPCLTALTTGSPVVSDFAVEDRWPEFTALALAEGFARASLSLPVAAAGQAPISLNLYTDEAGATDGIDQQAATVAAAALALSLTVISQRERLRNLEIALASSRLIGAAIGILMHRHRWTYQQSFDAMRVASQHGHRRLRDIADDVVMRGDLPS